MHSTSTRNALADQRRNTLMADAANLRLERSVRASKPSRTSRIASLGGAVRKLTTRRLASVATPSPCPEVTGVLADC
ncbi:MAG TPA: hypothetical protein VK611_09375 [Acidimicrobiales bacterium]|nr:hypothetical protein [Acidimicrobiales bacterium]